MIDPVGPEGDHSRHRGILVSTPDLAGFEPALPEEPLIFLGRRPASEGNAWSNAVLTTRAAASMSFTLSCLNIRLSYRPKLVTAGIGKAAYRGVLDASTSPPKERYVVSNDNVIQLIQPGIFDDQLTEVLRNGARALLAKAVQPEVAAFSAQ